MSKQTIKYTLDAGVMTLNKQKTKKKQNNLKKKLSDVKKNVVDILQDRVIDGRAYSENSNLSSGILPITNEVVPKKKLPNIKYS